MDGTFLLIMLLALVPAVIIIGGLWWLIRYNTRHTFMVKELSMYGGTITCQGVTFDVDKDAELKVGFGSLTVINPDGTMRRFVLGNAFTQQPVVTIKANNSQR